jgi:aldose 1-epimerase
VTVRLSAGSDSAQVDPIAGGRLASLVAGGRERLIDRPQPGAALPAISWGSFLMAPWVGRIAEGRVDWRGRAAQLPRNVGRHALHGVLLDVPWRVDRRDDASIELSGQINPGRWPFGGRAWQRLTLGPGSLRFEATLTADQPTPAALGWHPWFRRGLDEDLEVMVHADRRLELDAELIPSGVSVPVAGIYDLRAGPVLGLRRLDDVFVDAHGPAIVRWPDLELRIDFEAPLSSVVVFSPPGSVCVEPATAWPDALRLSTAGVPGTGQAVLESGETLAATMTWHW